MITDAIHRAGSEIGRHAHARAGFNLVLRGGYGEHTRGAFEFHPPATLIMKPAGEPHANRFDGSGARCLLTAGTLAVTCARAPCGAKARPRPAAGLR